MNEAKSQPWFDLYNAALLELNPQRLTERVDAAEAAIHGRLRDLQHDSNHHEERKLYTSLQRQMVKSEQIPRTRTASLSRDF
jgi:hypothetical protein